jgi:Flp pilus assembly secretin CpaC
MRLLTITTALLALAAPAIAQDAKVIPVTVYPGFVQRLETPAPFATIMVGDTEVLDAIPGKTNRDVLLQAKQPKEPGIRSTNVLAFDDEGVIVAHYTITVSPVGEAKQVSIIFGRSRTDYFCNGYGPCTTFQKPPIVEDERSVDTNGTVRRTIRSIAQ